MYYLPIEEYSKPRKVEKRKLCTLYYLRPRSQSVKPGRELIVAYDRRHPRIKHFEARYVYIVRFFKSGNVAGNHYHEKKEEVMFPIKGRLTVYLQDVKTKKREKIIIDAKLPVALQVKPRIAHAVASQTPGDVLLVLASNPSSENDDFEYKVV